MGVFEDVLAQTSRRPDGLSGVLERRRHKRAPTLRSSRTGLTSHLWELELVPAFGLDRLCDDIDRLSANSVDQNLFFESTVLRSAWPRLTNLLAPHGAWMLCLWETTGNTRKMRLFMPIRRNMIGFPRKAVLQPLSNEFMPVGTPLIDNDCADEAAETLLRLLSDPELNLPGILDFTHQREDSNSFDILLSASENLGLKSLRNNGHLRAALIREVETPAYSSGGLSKKGQRELSRQQRKLKEQGSLEFKSARSQDEILDAFEGFMTLELNGWKGRHGTALYNHKKIAAFSRQIVASLAIQNHCEIHSMNLDGKTIAGLIILGHNGRWMPWKIAFDENMATSSPGMQLMVHVTQKLRSRKTFVEADSLAVPDHWMMNRVWKDRIPIVDLTISLSPEHDVRLDSLIAAKLRFAGMKNFARPTFNNAKAAFKILKP